MSGSLPAGYVVFSLPRTQFTAGRIRFRVPERFKDEKFFKNMEMSLRKTPGVLDVKINPHTTSILIEHDDDEVNMLACIHQLQLFHLVHRDQIPRHRQLGSFPVFSKKERETMKVMALIALSCVQVFRGHALGAGTSLFDEAVRYWERLAPDKKMETGIKNG